MKIETNFPTKKIDMTPLKLSLISDIYLVFYRNRYVPAIDCLDIKKRQKISIFVSASSLASSLEALRLENDVIDGAEIWIHKESEERMAKYIMTAT